MQYENIALYLFLSIWILKPPVKSRGTIYSPTIRVNVSVKHQATMKDIGPHIIVSLLFTIKFQKIGWPKPRYQRHRFLHTELIAENFKIIQDKYTTRMEDQYKLKTQRNSRVVFVCSRHLNFISIFEH